MEKNLTRLMQSLLSPMAEAYQAQGWKPLLDIYRTCSGWLLKFELAGVRPEDIQVTRSGRLLTVRGHRRDWAISEGECAYSMEIAYNRFERTVQLPEELEDANITTEYRDGMLLVRVTKESGER